MLINGFIVCRFRYIHNILLKWTITTIIIGSLD